MTEAVLDAIPSLILTLLMNFLDSGAQSTTDQRVSRGALATFNAFCAAMGLYPY
jgi:hypothetical protein